MASVKVLLNLASQFVSWMYIISNRILTLKDVPEWQVVKRYFNITCPAIFVNVMLGGTYPHKYSDIIFDDSERYTGHKVKLSMSNANVSSTLTDPPSPVKWLVDIHTLEAWLQLPSNILHFMFIIIMIWGLF